MNLNFPFFIIGNPRSGTSLFRLMLHHHPDLVVPPECGFIEWWYNKYKDWNVEDLLGDRLNEFLKDLSSSKKIETWGLNFDGLNAYLMENNPDTYAELCAMIYTYYGLQKGKMPQKWGDKNNYYIHYLSKLLDIYPKALFILIVRDGRDVACSYRNVNQLQTISPYKPNLPNTITEIGLEWSGNHEKIKSFFDNLTEEKSITIRYEDLLISPHQEMKRIASFLNVEFDERMLHYFEDNVTADPEPKLLLDWKQKTLQAPDVKNIGKYQQELSREDLIEFSKVAGKWLKYFDYE